MQQLRVVVASPGDVQSERDLLPGVIDELNRYMGATLNVEFRLYRWETDAYPGFHSEGPQGLIDPILRIDDCDVLIGIFWKRFGTPTMDAGSGTEHEIRTAFEAWRRNQRPHIMVYFKEAECFPKSLEENKQLGKVLEFKAQFPKEGLWWPFTETEAFKNLVRQHLQGWLRDRFQQAPSGKKAEISHQLHETRQKAASAPGPGSRVPIDRGLITDYNLERLIDVFRKKLDSASTSEEGYEGAFSFLVRGPDRILEEYVIERLLKELSKTTGRESTKRRVWLHPGNLHRGLEALRAPLGIDHFRQLCEGTDDTNPDIVLIVGNRDIPPDKFLELAAEFWQQIKAQVADYLSNPSRCFIVLWADEHTQSVTQQVFEELPVPQQFELPSLRRWLWVELKRHGVDEPRIASLTRKIECHRGEIYCTYLTLRDELELLGRHAE